MTDLERLSQTVAAGSLETMISVFYDDAFNNQENQLAREWNDAGRHRLLGYAMTLSAFAYYAHGGGDIIEIGTYAGFGTMALAYGACKGGGFTVVHSIDINDSLKGPAKRRIDRCGLANTSFIHGTSDYVHTMNQPIGLAYIDGDHTHDGCLRDLRNISKYLWDEGKMLCHDYGRPDHPGFKYYMNGVTSAVEQFVSENSDFYAMWLGDGFMIVSRRLNEPLVMRKRQKR